MEGQVFGGEMNITDKYIKSGGWQKGAFCIVVVEDKAMTLNQLMQADQINFKAKNHIYIKSS